MKKQKKKNTQTKSKKSIVLFIVITIIVTVIIYSGAFIETTFLLKDKHITTAELEKNYFAQLEQAAGQYSSPTDQYYEIFADEVIPATDCLEIKKDQQLYNHCDEELYYYDQNDEIYNEAKILNYEDWQQNEQKYSDEFYADDTVTHPYRGAWFFEETLQKKRSEIDCNNTRDVLEQTLCGKKLDQRFISYRLSDNWGQEYQVSDYYLVKAKLGDKDMYIVYKEAIDIQGFSGYENGNTRRIMKDTNSLFPIIALCFIAIGIVLRLVIKKQTAKILSYCLITSGIILLLFALVMIYAITPLCCSAV